MNDRVAECYHCGGALRVPTMARTITCPMCYRGLQLDDLVVTAAAWGDRLQTCGRVIVEKKGQARTRQVIARTGVEVEGELIAQVTTGGTVHVGARATVKGDVEAAGLVVEHGARLEGFCRIGGAGGTLAG